MAVVDEQLEVVFRRHAPYLRGVLFRFVLAEGHLSVDDIVQDVFVKVLEGKKLGERGRFRDGWSDAEQRSWLRTAAVRTAETHAKRRRRRRRLEAWIPMLTVTKGDGDQFASAEFTQLHGFLSARFSPREIWAYILTRQPNPGMSTRDAAAELGCSNATVSRAAQKVAAFVDTLKELDDV